MESLSQEQRTLVQAAVNAVRIQLSKHATSQERLKAGEVRSMEFLSIGQIFPFFFPRGPRTSLFSSRLLSNLSLPRFYL